MKKDSDSAIAEKRILMAYTNLRRASDSLVARVNKALRRHNLRLSQFSLLECLSHLGPMSQAELGRKLMRTGGNVTMVIDNLERRKLVRRQRSDEDRRVTVVHLTELGKRLIEQVFPEHVELVTVQMSILTPDEQAELRRLCRILGTQQRDLEDAVT